ncbi:MAG: IMP dehydrogenase [candidate division Zixibacteria bacterium RBG_16_50_21]|nr:MAG: IMP dehydrogenase [candidate division Zixibacteria bacterium RBG_16_50_21]
MAVSSQDKRFEKVGLTFDDVLLIPNKSEIVPSQVEVSTSIAPHITMNVPILSAAMDTVTESRLALALAREGGMGIIHKNMTVARQALEVNKVKRSESGMIVDPVTLPPEKSIKDAIEVMKKYSISGIPVTKKGKLLGIITNRDLRFEKNLNRKIGDLMTKRNLVTAGEDITLEEAQEILHKHRIEKLLLVDRHRVLKGMITVKDIMKKIQYPLACKDERGRLRVGAAVGASSDLKERASALVKEEADLLVVDSSHGHSKNVLEAVESLKKWFPKVLVVAGNVATREGALDLIKAGADCVKVGIGPGSICTTRVVIGAGVPQLTAVAECAEVCSQYNVFMISDGGIRYSGDIVKALAAGADAVMVGSLFAGTEESPGETILLEGRSFKSYRGMGSIEAMRAGSRDRYFQEEQEEPAKYVPEGIEGLVPFKGKLSDTIFQLVGGLKSGMGMCGAKNVAELKRKARFIRLTESGLKESHPHSVFITKEAPNYRLRQQS